MTHSSLKWIVVTLALVAVACAGNKKPVMTPAREVAILSNPPTCGNPPEVCETQAEKEVRERALAIATAQMAKQVESAKRQNELPAVREARKEIEKSAKHAASRDKASRDALSRAAIQNCSTMKPGDVDPRAEQHDDRLNVMLRVTIVNDSSHGAQPEAYNITTPFRGIGVIARGLCSGSTMNITFRRENFVGNNFELVPLKAVPVHPNLQGVYTQERTFYLDLGRLNYERVHNEDWIIR